MLNQTSARAVCDAAERALGMESIIRYLDMHHWREESAQHHAAVALEPAPRLESVADHSWHIGYLLTLLLPYFPQLNARRCYELAVLHDILELLTGDQDPTGADGTGRLSYALDAQLAAKKDALEYAALDHYLGQLPAAVRASHETVLHEELAGTSAEARFIKVTDKIQSLLWIKLKKRGRLSLAGYGFLARYRDKTLPKFPDLRPLYDEVFARLRHDMIETQGLSEDEITGSVELRHR